ncbi:MAG: DUF1016 family protein [Bacteroidales bacterium]|nr:DUF1016 family protein [Bacteroidales bacterium]
MSNINGLVNDIQSVSRSLQENAARAINQHVTARNWLIGHRIFHYEQHGEDRATYGAKILETLAERLQGEGFSYRNLKLYRQFYLSFPELFGEVKNFLLSNLPIGQAPLAQLQSAEDEGIAIGQPTVAQSHGQILQPLVAESLPCELQVPPEKIFNRLSYSHLVQLLQMKDPLERAFYEIECINGAWSSRELKRQIDSNLYLRTGLSRNKDAAIALANQNSETVSIKDVVKSPYSFEFLGLQAKDVVEESDLESAIMDHLQEFLLELGYGFCFEGRQKRILIDNEYYFYDLLFYNRVLHCGVIIELKSKRLNYADLAQLNMYVNYYKANMMHEGDNPPVGILLCTEAGKETVEYAAPGMDENVFVSTYMLHLPHKEELLEWLKKRTW